MKDLASIATEFMRGDLPPTADFLWLTAINC